MRKPSKEETFSERGAVKALRRNLCKPLFASPGMTGTGAPVTERLRCPDFPDELGWYRESFSLAPIFGARFIFSL